MGIHLLMTKKLFKMCNINSGATIFSEMFSKRHQIDLKLLREIFWFSNIYKSFLRGSLKKLYACKSAAIPRRIQIKRFCSRHGSSLATILRPVCLDCRLGWSLPKKSGHKMIFFLRFLQKLHFSYLRKVEQILFKKKMVGW